MELNHTHDAARRSWLVSANEPSCDFPIQNLPFSVYRAEGTSETFRGGVAIGDQIVDLRALADSGLLEGLAARAAAACSQASLNEFFSMGPDAWSALRHGIFALLEDTASSNEVARMRACLTPQTGVEYAVPATIGDYTDFYTSLYHAENVGRLIQPDNPVGTNFHWLPVAYHGRVSSIGVSGQKFRRPMGQSLPPGATCPVYGPCARLDYEMELGVFIGRGNAQGEQIALDDVEQHVFGVCMLNDWSARDVQFWEMAPLGPFLGKNFCTTISPWIVTCEALAPFRTAWSRAASQPQPLNYLESEGNRAHGALDIQLEVSIRSAMHRVADQQAERISQTSFRHQYWTVGQMIAHHTVGGCNLKAGDLIGTGTISGPTQEEAGAILELTRGGQNPLRFSNGESRTFLQDGDQVVFKGWCERDGYARIGFGASWGEVLPSIG